VKSGRDHGQAALRAVLLAALCLGVGFGLGSFWHSRRAQRGGVIAGDETTAGANSEGSAPAAAATLLPEPAMPLDLAVVAEVKRRIPNLASVTLEQGSQILRAAALQDLQAAMSRMEPQLKQAEQEVARMEAAQSETGKQAALKELQRLQAEQAGKLGELAARSTLQIEALRQLKESRR